MFKHTYNSKLWIIMIHNENYKIDYNEILIMILSWLILKLYVWEQAFSSMKLIEFLKYKI